MGKLLEVERMTELQLWTTAIHELIHLVASHQGEIGYYERRGMARRALECVEELRIRGVQFKMDWPTGIQ